VRDNSEGEVLRLLGDAGFPGARTVARGALLMGRIAYYRAVAPGPHTASAEPMVARR
jgi:hypothetical protein